MNQQHPESDLERAMLADYVARLEKQLDAAERRAHDAEASAQDAQNALTEALLNRARDQKSTPGHGGAGAASAEAQLQALRAELAAARGSLLRHESTLVDIRETTEQDLRHEYEQKFHTARERMAQEFQKRLDDAQAAWSLETRDAPTAPAASGSRRTTPQPQRKIANRATAEKPAAVASPKQTPAAGPNSAKRWAIAALIAFAFAGGLFFGWSATPVQLQKEAVIATDSTAPAPIPAAVAAKPVAAPEPAPAVVTVIAAPEATPVPVSESAPAPAPVAQTPQREIPQSAAPSAAAPPVGNTINPLVPELTRLADQNRDALEHNAVLTSEIDALRLRLERANKRAQNAETALNAERQKAALRSISASAAGKQQSDQTSPDAASNAGQSETPGQTAPSVLRAPFPSPRFPAVE